MGRPVMVCQALQPSDTLSINRTASAWASIATTLAAAYYDLKDHVPAANIDPRTTLRQETQI